MASGEFTVSFWILKNPEEPRQTIVLFEIEWFWPGFREIGQRGRIIWGVGHLANALSPQVPMRNGILSFEGGRLPITLWASKAQVDGEPGVRSKNFRIDHLSASNSWHVQAHSPFANVEFTADDPVAGSIYTVPSGGNRTETTTMDPVINSKVMGSVAVNGRHYCVDGWRGQFWRFDVPSVFNSQLRPSTSWRGWEWCNVMEPDGGASQYYGVLSPAGQYSGVLVDARPSGTRVCSKTTLEFGDYEYGRSAFGNISPPFSKVAMPGSITVRSAPGEPLQMEKTFYPDSRDYADAGIFTACEMPMHTVPGSFGTYEHIRYMTFRMQSLIRHLRASGPLRKQ